MSPSFAIDRQVRLNKWNDLQLECLTNYAAKSATTASSISCRLRIRRITGIAIGHSEFGKKCQIFTLQLPFRLHWQHRLQQCNQIVNLREGYVGFTKTSLQIFLSALLSMKTYAVKIGFFRARDSRSTMAKPPSALEIHSAVIGFIQHLSLL